MGRSGDEFLRRMTDEEFEAACENARVMNAEAEALIAKRAEHRAKGGKLCYRCLALIPIGDEGNDLVATELGTQPVCGAACGAAVLEQTMKRFKSPGRMPRGMFRGVLTR
jgi:hypothetical protein